MAGARTSLILPTVHQRAALFARTLRYLEHCEFSGPILVSDHSPATHAGVISGCAGKHPDLQLQVLRHPPEMHFLDRLADCARSASTPFVHLHADDDFILPEVLPALEQALERGCVAALGAHVHVDLATGELTPSGKIPIGQAHPFARLVAQLESFTSVLYALRRREELIACFGFAVSRCPDVQFWQYLESCVAVLRGPIAVVEDLHYVRSYHEDKWSTSLVRGRSREHFPYLILSPELPARVQDFRDALEEACEATGVQVDAEALDDALVRLLYRGFGAMGLPPRRVAAGEPVAGSIADPDSAAAAGLRRIMAWEKRDAA